MANTEKELSRFMNDPKYREKMIVRIRVDQDKQYNQRVQKAKLEVSELKRKRETEIARIKDSRWEKLVGGKLKINHTEGKILFNHTEVPFSSICGAEVNVVSGYRVITTGTGETKKKASVGGAIAGGALLGPVGAVAAGVGLGKTKSVGNTVMNQIPTCIHLGVKVNVDGFVSEIVILSDEVDQTSKVFISAQEQAQNVVFRLGQLAKQPVPSSFLLPEEEKSVKLIEANIEEKQKELEAVIADKPTYQLPAMYKGKEYSTITDEEYLQLLREEDKKRNSKTASIEKSHEPQKVERRLLSQEDMLEIEDTAKGLGNLIYKVIFWGISLFLLLFAVAIGTSEGGVISGIFFLVAAIVINPSVVNFVNKKLFKFSRWLSVVIAVVSFFVAVFSS